MSAALLSAEEWMDWHSRPVVGLCELYDSNRAAYIRSYISPAASYIVHYEWHGADSGCLGEQSAGRMQQSLSVLAFRSAVAVTPQSNERAALSQVRDWPNLCSPVLPNPHTHERCSTPKWTTARYHKPTAHAVWRSNKRERQRAAGVSAHARQATPRVVCVLYEPCTSLSGSQGPNSIRVSVVSSAL